MMKNVPSLILLLGLNASVPVAESIQVAGSGKAESVDAIRGEAEFQRFLRDQSAKLSVLKSDIESLSQEHLKASRGEFETAEDYKRRIEEKKNRAKTGISELSSRLKELEATVYRVEDLSVGLEGRYDADRQHYTLMLYQRPPVAAFCSTTIRSVAKAGGPESETLSLKNKLGKIATFASRHPYLKMTFPIQVPVSMAEAWRQERRYTDVRVELQILTRWLAGDSGKPMLHIVVASASLFDRKSGTVIDSW